MSKAPSPTPPALLHRARHRPGIVHSAQAVVLLLLMFAAVYYGAHQRHQDAALTTEGGRTTQLEAIVAQACNAANFAELEKRGIVAECRLAQQGDLPSAIPSSAIPSPNANPTKVPANVIPDDTHVPSSIPAGTPEQIQEAVTGYFATHALPITDAYQRALSRATARFLTDHPPKPGHTPTTGEVRQVVTAVLLANPPPAGAPGVSVTQASLDGCDVVFTLSDGSTSRVGPVCGPKGDTGDTGPGPTDTQVAQAVAAYCQANSQCQGPTGVVKVIDNCPAADPGNFVTNVDATYDPDTQTITLSCSESGALGNGG